MKITIKQLKTLIKEQVEEVWMPPPMIKKYVPEEEKAGKNYREADRPDDIETEEEIAARIDHEDKLRAARRDSEFARRKYDAVVGADLWAVISIYAHAPNLIGVYTTRDSADAAARSASAPGKYRETSDRSKVSVVKVKLSK